MKWSATITIKKLAQAHIGMVTNRVMVAVIVFVGLAYALYIAATDVAFDDSTRAYYFFIMAGVLITTVIITLLVLTLMTSILRYKQLKDEHGTNTQVYELTKDLLRIVAGKDVMELAIDNFHVSRVSKSGIYLKRKSKLREYYLFFDSEDDLMKAKECLTQWL